MGPATKTATGRATRRAIVIARRTVVPTNPEAPEPTQGQIARYATINWFRRNANLAFFLLGFIVALVTVLLILWLR